MNLLFSLLSTAPVMFVYWTNKLLFPSTSFSSAVGWSRGLVVWRSRGRHIVRFGYSHIFYISCCFRFEDNHSLCLWRIAEVSIINFANNGPRNLKLNLGMFVVVLPVWKIPRIDSDDKICLIIAIKCLCHTSIGIYESEVTWSKTVLRIS